MTTGLGEGKIWIYTCKTSLRIDLVCSCEGVSKYVYLLVTPENNYIRITFHRIFRVYYFL